MKHKMCFSVQVKNHGLSGFHGKMSTSGKKTVLREVLATLLGKLI